MYYGVSQSTDMRCKNTIIKKFTSKKALQKWLSFGSGKYTYDDPELAQNYHHTFKYGYELTGRIDKNHQIFKDKGSPTYPRYESDNIAHYLATYGRQVNEESFS